MPIDLGSGVTVQVEPPTTPTSVVVPIAGPQGPSGPPGPPGDSAGAYLHTQSSPALLVQVQHGLSFKPAGVVCLENDGAVIEYAAITHPAAGITELTFGVPFVGVVYVS